MVLRLVRFENLVVMADRSILDVALLEEEIVLVVVRDDCGWELEQVVVETEGDSAQVRMVRDWLEYGVVQEGVYMPAEQ